SFGDLAVSERSSALIVMNRRGRCLTTSLRCRPRTDVTGEVATSRWTKNLRKGNQSVRCIGAWGGIRNSRYRQQRKPRKQPAQNQPDSTARRQSRDARCSPL